MKNKIIKIIVTLGIILPINVLAANVGVSCPSSVTVGDNITCSLNAYNSTLSAAKGSVSYSGMNYVSVTNNTGSSFFSVSSNAYDGTFDIANGSKKLATYTFTTSNVGTATFTAACSEIVDGVDFNTLSCTGGSASIVIKDKETIVAPSITENKTNNTSASKSNKSNNNVNTKELSNDANLKNINLSNGNLTFDSNKDTYDVTVPFDIDNINIIPEVNNSSATYTLEGNTKLQIGLNIIKIIVTAEDKTTTKTYTINITKEDKVLSNNSKALKIEIANYNFDFDANKMDYSLEISKEDYLTINVTPEDSLAKYEIENNENLKNNSKIKIKITAEDGSVTTYTIKIKKPNTKSSLLLNIILSIILILMIIVFAIYLKTNNLKFNLFKMKNNDNQ